MRYKIMLIDSKFGYNSQTAQDIDLFGFNPPCTTKRVQKIGYIDADIIGYRACCAAEKEIQFDSVDYDQTLFVNDFDTVKEIFDNSVNKIVNIYNLDSFYLCFSHKDNFRKKKVPFYKTNRVQPKPVHLKRITDHAKKNYNCLEHAGLEADDVCGVHCTEKVKGELRIAISVDKDFLTLPCCVGDLTGKRMVCIPWKEAFANLCMQILMGDSVDGYHGLKGVGKVKARGIINSIFKQHHNSPLFCVDVFNSMIGEYVNICDVDREEAVDYFWDNVRCAYILRHGDYDFEKKRVRLISHNNFYEMLKEKK